MTTTLYSPMAKQPKSEADGPTRMIRAKRPLADMLGWVSRVEGVTAAELLEMVLRPPLAEKYRQHYTTISTLKRIEDQRAIAAGVEPEPPIPVPDGWEHEDAEAALKQAHPELFAAQKWIEFYHANVARTPVDDMSEEKQQELNLLANEFNSLTKRLRQIYEDLRKRKDDREQELLNQYPAVDNRGEGPGETKEKERRNRGGRKKPKK